MVERNYESTLFPKNVADARSGAPDEATPVALGSSDFRFPVHNFFFSKWIELPLILCLPYLAGIIGFMQRNWDKDHQTHQWHNILIANVTAIGLYLILQKEAMRTRIDQLLIIGACFISALLLFAIPRWHVQLVVSIFALLFLVDRFIAHGTYLRSGAPRTLQNAPVVKNILATRFSLLGNGYISLLDYGIPFLIFAITCLLTRNSLKETPDNNHTMFLISGLVFLLAYPIVSDQVAVFSNRRPLGILSICRSFGNLIVSWLNYNPVGTLHPAVIQSPAGSCLHRRLAILGVVLISVPVIFPQNFFLIEIEKSMQDHEKSREEFRKLEYELTKDAKPVAFYQFDDNAESNVDMKVRDAQPQFRRDALPLDTELLDSTIEKEKRDAETANKFLRDTIKKRERDIHGKHYADRPEWVFEKLGLFFLSGTQMILPLMLMCALLFSVSGRSMASMTEYLGPIPDQNVFTTANWSPLTQQLRQSSDSEDELQILWGVDARDQTPVIVPRSALREHVHFIGDTGSGKTSLGLAPLLTQLAERGDCSIVVLDLKGDDLQLFEIIREAAKENNRSDSKDASAWTIPFRFFTSKRRDASHIFNPFEQRAFLGLTPLQKADLLSTALGLQYGTDYGRKFFSDANFKMLQNALIAKPSTKSFQELNNALEDDRGRYVDRETRMAAANLRTSVSRLASIPQINLRADKAPSPSSMIDLADLFERPQSVFFSLPAATGSVVNAELARLVLFNIINAAQFAKKPRTQVFIVIDEFQRVVSGNIEVLLQMARSHDVGLILANQSLSDLKKNDADILATVMSNTRIRQIFGLLDPKEIASVMEISGNRLIWTRALDFANGLLSFLGAFTFPRSYSTQETVVPRLTSNDLIEASNHPFRSVFHMSRGKGLAQFGGYPFILESVFHIDETEFKRRMALPWPEPTESAIVYDFSDPVNDTHASNHDVDANHKPSQAPPPVDPSPVNPSPVDTPPVKPATQNPAPIPEDLAKLLGALDGFKKKD